jgi:hypothetical protein
VATTAAAASTKSRVLPWPSAKRYCAASLVGFQVMSPVLGSIDIGLPEPLPSGSAMPRGSVFPLASGNVLVEFHVPESLLTAPEYL